jgi:hypothetical protein
MSLRVVEFQLRQRGRPVDFLFRGICRFDAEADRTGGRSAGRRCAHRCVAGVPDRQAAVPSPVPSAPVHLA